MKKNIYLKNQNLVSCFDKSLTCILATLPNIVFDTNLYNYKQPCNASVLI